MEFGDIIMDEHGFLELERIILFSLYAYAEPI